MIPFTRRWGVSLTPYAVNGIRGAAALPLSIPAAPRGNRCCALRSPLACLTAAGSTRHPVSVRLCPPSMASRPCHSRFGSPISGGSTPSLSYCRYKTALVSLKARFCRPDKAQPPSGNGAAERLPDGAYAYPAYAVPAATRNQSWCGGDNIVHHRILPCEPRVPRQTGVNFPRRY